MMRLFQITLSSVVVMCALPFNLNAQLADTPWPTFGGDERNTHRSKYIGPATTPSVKWSYSTPDSYPVYSPIITPDGAIVYTTNGSATIDRFDHLIALNRDGTLRWSRTNYGYSNWSSVDVAGQIYAGQHSRGGGGSLEAIRQDTGSTVWAAYQLVFLQNGSVISSDGTVYFADQDGPLLSYQSDGTFNWAGRDGGGYNNAPAIHQNGNILAAYRSLYSFRPDGTVNWVFSDPLSSSVPLFYSPAIADNGTIYVGSPRTSFTQTALHALDPNGNLLWSFIGAGQAPSIASDGTIYAGSPTKLFAINPDGTEKWHFDIDGQGDASGASHGVTIDAEDNFFFTDQSGMLYSLDPNGNLRWSVDLAPDDDGYTYPTMPIIDADGSLYVGVGSERTFLALTPEPSSFIGLLITGMIVSARRRCRL